MTFVKNTWKVSKGVRVIAKGEKQILCILFLLMILMTDSSSVKRRRKLLFGIREWDISVKVLENSIN